MANAAGSGGKSAARLKRRNESKMIMRQPIMLISILTVIVLLLLFVIYPLVKILLFSLTDASGTFSLATAAEIFSTSRYLKTFGRTMVLGVIVAVIATFIGYIFAYTITRTNVPCKGFLKTIATLPILSPPFILCLSIIFLFGRQGLITNGLLKITDNDVYGMGSLIVVQVLSFFPIAYMTLSGILSSIDASVEDAACNMGASRWHTFWTVTFPLSLPGIISGCLLVFIQSLEDFSNPATIGGDFTTLSVEVYQTITGSYDMQKGSVLALLMLVPTMLAYLLNKYWVNKKSFVTVTGKPTQARKLIDEPHIKWPLFAVCLVVAAVIILFYGTVVFGSFVKTWGYDYTLTLDQYTRALQQGWDSLRNSIILGLIGALIGGLLVADEYGIKAWLTQALGGLFSNHSPLLFVAMTVLITLVLTNFFSNTATLLVVSSLVSALSGPLVEAGYDITILAVAISLSSMVAYLTYASSGQAAILLSQKNMDNKFIWTYGIAAMLLYAAVVILVSAVCLFF